MPLSTHGALRVLFSEEAFVSPPACCHHHLASLDQAANAPFPGISGELQLSAHFPRRRATQSSFLTLQGSEKASPLRAYRDFLHASSSSTSEPGFKPRRFASAFASRRGIGEPPAEEADEVKYWLDTDVEAKFASQRPAAFQPQQPPIVLVEPAASAPWGDCEPTDDPCPKGWLQKGTSTPICEGAAYHGPCRPVMTVDAIEKIGKIKFMERCNVDWDCKPDPPQPPGPTLVSPGGPMLESGPIDPDGDVIGVSDLNESQLVAR